MEKNAVETLIGAVVLLIAASFIFISYKSGNISTNVNGYKVIAKFHEVGSLSIGSDVRVGGIKVGAVSNQYLDNNTYSAIVEIDIKSDVKIPVDSTAAIVGDGLLGGKYLAITPGGDDVFLKSGEEIKYTQDAVNLESLLGKFAFGSVDKKEE